MNYKNKFYQYYCTSAETISYGLHLGDVNGKAPQAKYKIIWLWLSVLPGDHLCSVDALRLPDDANSLLRVVKVVQQHAYHVVPVFRTLIGPCSVLIPGAHSTRYICFFFMTSLSPVRQTLILRTYLPSASFALAYCRWIFGEETCGSSSPTFVLNVE